MSNERAPYEYCRATRANGEPCRGRALASGLCFAHDPAMNRNQSKGGRNRSNAARSYKHLPGHLRPVADILAGALHEVHTGALDPRAASAMASLASALVRVVTAGEYEDRLRAIEQSLAANAGA